METHQTSLDIPTILRSVEIIEEIFGHKWINKKLKKVREKTPPKNMRKFSYLFQKPNHPLIDWFIGYKQWAEESMKTRRMVLSADLLKLSTLGIALKNTRSQNNFSRVVKRLKSQTEFYSASFEVEVASSYVNRNWGVEFVEEGSEKTPDLLITRTDGSTFWVECKRRDQLTQRDKTIESIWLEFEQLLLGYIGPHKLNYLIVVKALIDPIRSDVKYLYGLIVKGIDKGGLGTIDPESNRITGILDNSRRFELTVQKLANPDEEFESDGINYVTNEDYDRVTMLSEMKVESDKSLVRNPIISALKNTNSSDKVTGVINALKKAVKQIPKGGPSVVWIRIPDNSWGDNVNKSFKQIQGLLKRELTNNHNTRVNAAIIMTRYFEKEKDGKREGLFYRPLKMIVEHDNPNTPIPENSE